MSAVEAAQSTPSRHAVSRTPRGRAVLALADGTVFHGESVGAAGSSSGEVVFNTAMTGYQEILTDPSYAKQIVTLTYPHVGNVGVNAADAESGNAFAAGLVVRDLSRIRSNFRAEGSLEDWLRERNVTAISGVDTRALTRRLREHGAQGGCIVAADAGAPAPDAEAASAAARGFPGLLGMDLAREVSAAERYRFDEGRFRFDFDPAKSLEKARYRVVAYDLGVKRNILRELRERGCEVIVVPAGTSADEAMALAPDGVFLSNGPGDPEPCDYVISATRTFLDRKLPVFGICLGHQILALALGAKTLKMSFGHHGANHPVLEVDTQRVLVTSQNHGFAVDESTLPAGVRATHRSLFDGSLQGIACEDRPAFGFQGHPEASPGPHDVSPLFDRFISLMRVHAG